MKKYILLATTAVLMTTANAMAAGDVTVDQPLGVKAELTPLAALTHVSDLNFGGMVFDKTALGTSDYVSFGIIGRDSDALDLSTSPAVKATYGSTSRGKYTYTGSLNLNDANRTLTIGEQSCTEWDADGHGAFGSIDLGGNAKLDSVGVRCTASPKECYFDGALLVKRSYLEGLESTATLDEKLTITYNY